MKTFILTSSPTETKNEVNVRVLIIWRVATEKHTMLLFCSGHEYGEKDIEESVGY